MFFLALQLFHRFVGWQRWHRSRGDRLNELLDHLVIEFLLLLAVTPGDKPVLQGKSDRAAAAGALDVGHKA